MCIFETQQLVATHRGTVMHLTMPESATSSKRVEDRPHIPHRCNLPTDCCWDRTSHADLRMFIIISCGKVGSSFRTDGNVMAKVYKILYRKVSLSRLGRPGDFLEGTETTEVILCMCRKHDANCRLDITSNGSSNVVQEGLYRGNAPCAGSKLPNQKSLLPDINQLF